MNIGVLTWKLYNYGTALQAYSLVTFINRCNVSCSQLNYTLPSREEIIKVNPNSLLVLINRIARRIIEDIKARRNSYWLQVFSCELCVKTKKFEDFYARVPHDSHEVSIKEQHYFNYRYDKIIIGSDQVWNPKYFCSTYFGDFVEPQKRYSYAPSLGVSVLSKPEIHFLADRLSTFQKISVREISSKKILERILPDKEICAVLDPTLLFTGKEWRDNLSLSLLVRDKYILVYTLSGNKWYKEAIRKIQLNLNIENIIVLTSDDNLFFYKKDRLILDAGPKEFLELIDGATYVITDSFHGTCFSILFEKNFTCLRRFNNNDRRGENSRLSDLLNMLGLAERITTKYKTINTTKINYINVNKRLEELRSNSIEYLLDLIQ